MPNKMHINRFVVAFYSWYFYQTNKLKGLKNLSTGLTNAKSSSIFEQTLIPIKQFGILTLKHLGINISEMNALSFRILQAHLMLKST